MWQGVRRSLSSPQRKIKEANRDSGQKRVLGLVGLRWSVRKLVGTRAEQYLNCRTFFEQERRKVGFSTTATTWSNEAVREMISEADIKEEQVTKARATNLIFIEVVERARHF